MLRLSRQPSFLLKKEKRNKKNAGCYIIIELGDDPKRCLYLMLKSWPLCFTYPVESWLRRLCLGFRLRKGNRRRDCQHTSTGLIGLIVGFIMDNEITLFAETNFRNERIKFGIKKDDRRRHMYILGKTGM